MKHSKLASKKDGALTRRKVDRNEQYIKEASRAVDEATLLQTEDAGFLEAEGPLARTYVVVLQHTFCRLLFSSSFF